MPIVPVSARTNPNLATFKILSEGTEIPPEIGVAMIAVTQAVNKLPAARIVLFDGDVASQDFEVSGGDFFIPGKKITVKAGYNNNEEVIFEGIIIRHGIKARGGASKLILELRDPAVKMTIGRKNKYFFDSKDSEIIEDLISEYGLASEIEATTTTHKEMVQFYCSDWDFMLTRAELNSKLILVENGKVKMKSAEVSADAKLKLEFGTNVVEMEAEMDARTQYASSKSKGWDMANQELLELESPDPGIDFQGDLSGQELARVIGLEDFTLLHGGAFSGEELQNWADANMLKSRLSKIKAQIKILGENTIKPGDMVQLSGFGSRFNGKAFVSSVYHEVSPSQKWFTTLGLGLDHRFISSVFDDIIAVPAAGLVPAMKGLHIGKVTGLEDPDGENRVKVLLPMIDSSSEGTWARLATMDAGGEGVRGAVFYPEIGDEVIVGFINEDPRQPIILGSLFSSANASPIEVNDDNFIKGYTSKTELKLHFDDEKKSIRIETPGGRIVEMSDEDGWISMEDESGNKVILDRDGITMESSADFKIKATGDVKIEGMNVDIESSAQLTAKGGAGAEFSSSGQTIVKGSLIQIN